MSRRRKWRQSVSRGPVCIECKTVRPRIGVVCAKCRRRDGRDPVYPAKVQLQPLPKPTPPLPASKSTVPRPTAPLPRALALQPRPASFLQCWTASVRPTASGSHFSVPTFIVGVCIAIGALFLFSAAGSSSARTSTYRTSSNWTPSPADAPQYSDYANNPYYDPPNMPNGDVGVRGYYRKDGTYVRPHYRSKPDGIKSNNYSYPGNRNPYKEW
jgi:hypothetical protein